MPMTRKERERRYAWQQFRDGLVKDVIYSVLIGLMLTLAAMLLAL